MLLVNQQLTQEEYKEMRWNVIRYMEESGGEIQWRPYVDTADPPQTTIGVGFNIEANDETLGVKRDTHPI